MDETTRELNRELREMHEEMTSPHRQAERALKARQQKRVDQFKQRIGL